MYAGQHVLLTAHVAIFKIICATGALAFSVYNLVAFAWELGKDRQLQHAASSEPFFASTAPSHAMFEYDDSLCVITNCPSRPDTPHWRWLAPFYSENPRARRWVESVFPRISEAHRKTESCVTALTLSSLVSGFLLGLTGSATSPTLMAFRSLAPPLHTILLPLVTPSPNRSYIDATKASIRGIIGAPLRPSSFAEK
jgi:hypothetical protein